MAWRRIGDKPLSEPMLSRLTYAYKRHYGEINKHGFYAYLGLIQEQPHLENWRIQGSCIDV